jgi:hypothetical protein
MIKSSAKSINMCSIERAECPVLFISDVRRVRNRKPKR